MNKKSSCPMFAKKQIPNILLFILLTSPIGFSQGPTGYTAWDKEQNFKEPTNVAFGDSGIYKYLFNQIGPVTINDKSFFGRGIEPAEGKA